MFGTFRRFVSKVKEDLGTVASYHESEKYADVLFEIVRQAAVRAAIMTEDYDPGVAPEIFSMKLKGRWSEVREAFLEPLSPKQERELTGFALTMPSTELTTARLAEMKERLGEDKAYRYGATLWAETLFDFYCDRIVKDFPSK